MTALTDTRSAALYERALELIPGGVNSPVRAMRAIGRDPIFIDRGEGAEIIDVDANRYIDYVCSWGPLIHGHAHQVGHNFRESMVMISFHPHDLNLMSGVGELANVPQELPMLFCQAAEVQVGEDITQQNQPLEPDRLQESQRSVRLADLGAEMQIGNDDGIEEIYPHAPYL